MAAEGLYPMEIETAEEGLHAIHCDLFFIIRPMPVTTARDPKLAAAFAPLLPQFRINFTLSCYSTVSNWVLEQDEHLLSSHTLPTAGNDVVLNLTQFLCPPLSREIMKLELWNWPLADEQREEIIDSALKFARIAVVSMPAKHNVVNLQIRVDDTHKHFFVRSDDLMNRVIGESFDVETQKVPAANSAVEVVVKKKVRLNPESGIICTICLDECGSGKAVRMPCSHLFHGDCIGKWLRIDHCCPVCRFELPVEEEDERENMEDCDEALKEV